MNALEFLFASEILTRLTKDEPEEWIDSLDLHKCKECGQETLFEICLECEKKLEGQK